MDRSSKLRRLLGADDKQAAGRDDARAIATQLQHMAAQIRSGRKLSSAMTVGNGAAPSEASTATFQWLLPWMDEMLSHALHTLDGMANGTSLSQMDPDETVTVL